MEHADRIKIWVKVQVVCTAHDMLSSLNIAMHTVKEQRTHFEVIDVPILQREKGRKKLVKR